MHYKSNSYPVELADAPKNQAVNTQWFMLLAKLRQTIPVTSAESNSIASQMCDTHQYDMPGHYITASAHGQHIQQALERTSQARSDEKSYLPVEKGWQFCYIKYLVVDPFPPKSHSFGSDCNHTEKPD